MNHKEPNFDLEYSNTDHFSIAARAIIQVVPVIGGPVGVFMDAYMPLELNKRRDSFLLELKNDIERLSEKINKNVFESPHFITIFLHCYRGVQANHRTELVLAYRAILLGVLVGDEVDEDELSCMLRITDLLTPLHIKLLKLIRDPGAYIAKNPVVLQALDKEGVGAYSLPVVFYPEYDQHLIHTVLDDMKGMGLHKGFTDNPIWIKDKVIIPTLTEFGMRYISFITKNLEISE